MLGLRRRRRPSNRVMRPRSSAWMNRCRSRTRWADAQMRLERTRRAGGKASCGGRGSVCEKGCNWRVAKQRPRPTEVRQRTQSTSDMTATLGAVVEEAPLGGGCLEALGVGARAVLAWFLPPLCIMRLRVLLFCLLSRIFGDRGTLKPRHVPRQSANSRKLCLASGGCNFGKTRPWLGLVDLSRIPSRASSFFSGGKSWLGNNG